MSTFNNFCVCVAASLLILSVGCGGEKVVPMGTLSGTVSSGGEPYAKCKVKLVHVKTSLAKGCMVDELGKFRFEGLKFGDYKLAVIQFISPYAVAATPFDKNIPEKYRSIDTSGLEVSVPTTEEVVFDFDMKK